MFGIPNLCRISRIVYGTPGRKAYQALRRVGWRDLTGAGRSRHRRDPAQLFVCQHFEERGLIHNYCHRPSQSSNSESIYSQQSVIYLISPQLSVLHLITLSSINK
jgi:hypothetical protein